MCLRKRIAVVILLLYISVSAAAPGIRVLYPDSRSMTVEVDLGEHIAYQWTENGEEFRRYAFDHTNNHRQQNNSTYEILQFPVAVGDRIPNIRIEVIETEYVKHSIRDHRLYDIGDLLQYRDISFVYLTINPFLENGNVMRRFRVHLEFSTSLQTATPDIMNRFFINSSHADAMASRVAAKKQLHKPAVFSGEWLSVRIAEEGIYAISRSDLREAGISGNIEDSKVYLFAGRTFGGPLRQTFPDSSDFHLKEVPLLFLDAPDDDDDQWVFYASGNSAWERGTDNSNIRQIRYIRNAYESVQHFRLFVGNAENDPKRMVVDVPAFSGSEVVQPYAYRRLHHEQELINPGKGGDLWLGERLSSSRSFSFFLTNLYRESSVSGALRLGFGYTTAGNHEFKTYLSGSPISTLTAINSRSANDQDTESSITRKTDMLLSNSSLSEELSLRIDYRGEYATSEAYLDYISIIYPAYPTAQDGYLHLWFTKSETPRKVLISGLTAAISYVFGVEDPFETYYYPLSGTSGDILIPASDKSTSFIVLNEGHFRTPVSLSKLPGFIASNAGDHASQTDFIIITPEVFLSEAQRLAAHKESRPAHPMRTMVKTYSEIIGQFNAGNRDPYAIRHFLSNMYHHAPEPKPKYVLLLGDGHYDVQNRIHSAPVFIPYLYESNILWPCDDIYVMVSSVDDITNDMAIGRIPANSIDEVRAVIDKIIEYDNRTNPGEWQLNAMLVADDPSDPEMGSAYIGQTMFITDSERLWNTYLPRVMQTKKVYLTEYPERYVTELQTMGRDGAREDIMDTFRKGVAFVNFYGHGDASVWTQEKVFVNNDLVRLDTDRQYPIILAATCSWGRSDMPDFQSTAEDILTMNQSGAIATIAAVRGVYHGGESTNNVKFVQDFMTGLFTGNPDHAYTPLLGDAVLYAKNRSNNTSGTVKINNNMKFMFFGDPTLIPAFPQYGGEIDPLESDTLRALDRVTISGRALGREGDPLSGMGQLQGRLTVYDNNYTVSREYVGLGGATYTISYSLEGNRLFNGGISFDGDAFSTQIFIPKDIQYHGSRGKVRMMYWNENGIFHGSAAIDTIHVGGINPEAPPDVVGPDIKLYTGDQMLNNGAVVYDTSTIRIVFEDQSGINITGTKGHVLEMRINDGAHTVDLSSLFSYSQDSFTRGHVEFPVHHYFDPGDHRIEIVAFDNYNNYSQIEMAITVLSEDSDLITHLVNFPNPFKGRTDFTFLSAVNGLASIRIYSISGRPVATLNDQLVRTGFNALPWQAEDNYGHTLAAGVYFYVLHLEYGDEKLRYQNKMLILP